MARRLSRLFLDALLLKYARDRMAALEKERDKLNSDVETLRQFEREYRSRLKTYFTQQLEALANGAESQAPVDSGNAPKRLRSVLGDDEG